MSSQCPQKGGVRARVPPCVYLDPPVQGFPVRERVRRYPVAYQTRWSTHLVCFIWPFSIPTEKPVFVLLNGHSGRLRRPPCPTMNTGLERFLSRVHPCPSIGSSQGDVLVERDVFHDVPQAFHDLRVVVRPVESIAGVRLRRTGATSGRTPATASACRPEGKRRIHTGQADSLSRRSPGFGRWSTSLVVLKSRTPAAKNEFYDRRPGGSSVSGPGTTGKDRKKTEPVRRLSL